MREWRLVIIVGALLFTFAVMLAYQVLTMPSVK